MIEKDKETIDIDYVKKQNREVNSLDSGLKRLTIEIGFVIMVISAICTLSSVGDVMRGSLAGTICLALINTVGMVTDSAKPAGVCHDISDAYRRVTCYCRSCVGCIAADGLSANGCTAHCVV